MLVVPGAQLWLDVWIPRHDALWSDDVVQGAYWLGEAWARALRFLGVGVPEVRRGRASTDAWSRLVCFAGLGPGEVTVEGRKVVGLAQRRTAAGARLHSVALLHWDPAPLLGLLSLAPVERTTATSRLAGLARGLGELLGPPDSRTDLLGTVAEAVVSQLP